MMPGCNFHMGVECILSDVRLPCGTYSEINISLKPKNEELYFNENDLGFKLKD